MLIILLLSLIIFVIIKTFKVYDFLNSEKILKCKNDYIRSMKSIVLFGAGNVALHLCKAINNSKNFQVIQVYSKTKKSPGIYFTKNLQANSLQIQVFVALLPTL